MRKEKIGIIDVGSGYRGIYAAGVLDYCMDHQIIFDVGIGVSAGSANLISYAAGQKGQNYLFFSKYGLHREYSSLKNFLCKRSFIDMDYVYSTLSNSNGENPLDYPAFRNHPMELIVVATKADTGEPQYFNKTDISQDDYSVLKASCAIPFVCHPYAVNNTLYYDGALSDCVPIEKAFESGCDRVILLLTLPEHTIRTSKTDNRLAARIQKKYPHSAEKLRQRAEHYNQYIRTAQELVKTGKVLIVAPDDTCGVKTLSKDVQALDQLYQKGYQDGQKINDFLKIS